MQRLRLAMVCTLVLAAACQDPPSAPLRPDLPEPPPDLRIAARQYEGMEGYRSPPDAIRSGFIRGRNGEPQQITYAVHGDLAIWQGDIILGPANAIATSRHELELLAQGRQPVIGQGVVIDGNGFRWPGGVIPYEIDTDLPNQSRVTGAIAMVEEATAGVTLVPRDGEANYVRFTTGDGCLSAVGMQGGRQDITLADGCSTGNAAHEILHALGMYHEHTRCDRDDFVTINDAEIEEDQEHNFTKQCDDATDIDVYDEGSIMHYGPFAFAIGTEPTIESKRGRDADMGQRSALGPTDIATINELYGHHNQSPIAVIGPLEDSYPEGSAVMFDGSGSSDPDDAVLFHSWTFGDGTCVASPPLKCTQESPTHIYVDDAIYPVSLTASDGFLEHVANTTVTVLNVAPVVSAGPDGVVNEGSLYTGSGSFTDPGVQDAPWTATVDYGDGPAPEPLGLVGPTFSLAHTWVDNLPGEAPYTVTVAVTDKDGGTGMDDLQVTVRNVAPFVLAGADATVTSGETFDFSGRFQDPGVEDDPWDWEIDWGDGETSTGSTADQSAPITESRQVCLAGEYQVTLSVTDKDGGEGTDDLTLTVPYFAVDIAIMHDGEPTPVNLRRNGVLPVAILSTAAFAATDIDPATVVLGDEAGGDTPVALHSNGSYRASMEDVNGDGLPDLVLMFDIPALVANGDLTGASTSLVLRGFLDDGCTNFRGEGPVTVRP